MFLDTSSRTVRDEFKKKQESEQRELRDMLKKHKIDTIFLSTDRPYIDDVRNMFRQRQVRAGR